MNRRRLTLDQVVLWYVRVLSLALLLQGALGCAAKVAEGRSDDLFHNGLHILSGGLGAICSIGPGRETSARNFARGFGLFYVTLGVVGWFWANPLGVLPLAPADNLFHMIVGGVTLVSSL